MLHTVPQPPLGWQDMGHQTTEEVPGRGEGRGQKVNAVSTERAGVNTVFNIGGLVSDKPFVIKAAAWYKKQYAGEQMCALDIS